MSLVPEIKPEDHRSVEEMQEDKTAVQMKGGTYEDEREMSRMGKTQELRVCSQWSVPGQFSCTDLQQRNFKFIGIVGFVSILQSTWENTLLASFFGLFNGGTAGIIYGTIAVWLFMMCMIASMYVPTSYLMLTETDSFVGENWHQWRRPLEVSIPFAREPQRLT